MRLLRLEWLGCVLVLGCGDPAAAPSPSGGAGGASSSSSSSSSGGGGDGVGGGGGGGGAPTACSVDLGLRSAKTVLADAADPCRDWIEAVHGRTASVTFGSGSVWSRRTQHGTGILTTAAHIASPCPHDGADCPAALHDPGAQEGSAFVKLSQIGGGPPKLEFSAHFALYTELIPASENVGNLSGVLPRHDVTLFAVDSQTFEDDGTSIAHIPDPIVDAELPLHDPEGLTLARPTWASPADGARVLLAGYPAGGDHAGELAASVGRVMGAAEVEAALAALAAAGDEEGSIPYDPEAEMVLEGHALVGMSGSGVFDEAGRQVGILVRASTAEIGVQYVRAVRMSFVVSRIEEARQQLPADLAAAVAPYLEPR
jgi:hypothetical protein